MKTYLVAIGKTDDMYIAEGIEKYKARINKYHSFEIRILPDIKKSRKLSAAEQKKLEGEILLNELNKFEKVILLDEKGKSYTSMNFAKMYQQFMISSTRSLAFVIGGPYGFSKEVYRAYSQKITLSDLTFSHQLVRLLFLEQLYRINTIIKGEPYHHQ